MCPICHDTYWKSIEVDGIERVACCECWREALVDRALADAGIPPGYRHCSLNNFEHRGTNSLMEALRAAAAFAERFPVVDKGLFFLGPPGVGKTHLAVAALREVIGSRGARGYFYKTGGTAAEDPQHLQQQRRRNRDGDSHAHFRCRRARARRCRARAPDRMGAGNTGSSDRQALQQPEADHPDRQSQRRQQRKDFVDSVQFRLGPRTRSRLLGDVPLGLHRELRYARAGDSPHRQENRGVEPAREKQLHGQVSDKPKGMAKARLRAGGDAVKLVRREGRLVSTLGLYLHIPFCAAICNFRNFNRGLLDEGLKTRTSTP